MLQMLNWILRHTISHWCRYQLHDNMSRLLLHPVIYFHLLEMQKPLSHMYYIEWLPKVCNSLLFI